MEERNTERDALIASAFLTPLRAFFEDKSVRERPPSLKKKKKKCHAGENKTNEPISCDGKLGVYPLKLFFFILISNKIEKDTTMNETYDPNINIYIHG